MADPFTLRVTFSGLCLFALEHPNETSRHRRLHVLMPATQEANGSRSGAGAMSEMHAARLLFSRAHRTGKARDLAKLDEPWDLTANAIDLSALQARDPVPPYLPHEIIDLDPYVRAPLSRDYTNMRPDDRRLKSRVTLGAGRVRYFERGGPWLVGADQRPSLAWRVSWMIQGIELDCLRLAQQYGGSSVELHPIDGCIDLYVYHAPAPEIPPNTLLPCPPAPSGPAMHFHYFYGLFDGTPGPGPSSPLHATTRGPFKLVTGSSGTCMHAKASFA